MRIIARRIGAVVPILGGIRLGVAVVAAVIAVVWIVTPAIGIRIVHPSPLPHHQP